MTICADECVYQMTVDALRSWDFSVITVQEAGLTGCQNGEVLAYAHQHGHIFLTRDKDFTDTRIYPPAAFSGIIVIKVSPRNQHEIHAILHQLLSEYTLNELQAKLTIVDRQKYRIVDDEGRTRTVLKK